MFGNVVKPMVLATLLFGKCCKTNGSSNIVLGNVVKPMVLATLFLEIV